MDHSLRPDGLNGGQAPTVRFLAVCAALFASLLMFSMCAARAEAASNLVSNPSFEQSDANGNPADWVKGRWGTNTTSFAYPVAGPSSPKAGKVQVAAYSSGDAKWAFRPVAVTGGAEYSFSDWYQSSVTTYVTVEFKHANGTVTYKDIGTLPPASGWASFNASFVAPSTAVTASVYHVIKSVGELSVDDYSLEEKGSLPPPPPPPPQDPDNLVTNASLEGADASGNPIDWKKGRWGTNTAAFDYPVSGQDGDRAARIRMTARTTGDAKWVFKEVSVQGGHTYKFSNWYMSDVPTHITLQYRMGDGSFRYPDLAMLPPASDWTESEHLFKAPAGAVAVTVFHLINQVGSLSVDAYQLSEDATPPPPSKGIVTLSFDDGTRSIYDTAVPILDAAGLRSTQYIVSGRFEFPGYVNEQEVLDMQAKGHEIGAHTVTHANLTAVSTTTAKYEIERSRQDLLAIGVNEVKTMAYPFGAYNDAVKQMAMDAGYGSARSTDGGYNSKGLLNLFALARQPVNVNNSAAQVKGWIDTALANDKWLILAFHHVDRSGELYSTTPETLQEIVNYLKSKNVKVVTVSEGVEMMK